MGKKRGSSSKKQLVTHHCNWAKITISGVKIVGHDNTITGDDIVMEGNWNTLRGNRGILRGNDIKAYGDDNQVYGKWGFAKGKRCIAIGDDCKTVAAHGEPKGSEDSESEESVEFRYSEDSESEESEDSEDSESSEYRNSTDSSETADHSAGFLAGLLGACAHFVLSFVWDLPIPATPPVPPIPPIHGMHSVSSRGTISTNINGDSFSVRSWDDRVEISMGAWRITITGVPEHLRGRNVVMSGAVVLGDVRVRGGKIYFEEKEVDCRNEGSEISWEFITGRSRGSEKKKIKRENQDGPPRKRRRSDGSQHSDYADYLPEPSAPPMEGQEQEQGTPESGAGLYPDLSGYRK